jgi:hypothetical protein
MESIEILIEDYINALNEIGIPVEKNTISWDEEIANLEAKYNRKMSHDIRALYTYFPLRKYPEEEYLFNGDSLINLREIFEPDMYLIEIGLDVSLYLKLIDQEIYQKELIHVNDYWPTFESGGGDTVLVNLVNGYVYSHCHDDPYGADIYGLRQLYISLKNMLKILTACARNGVYTVEEGRIIHLDLKKEIAIHLEMEPGLEYWEHLHNLYQKGLLQ